MVPTSIARRTVQFQRSLPSRQETIVKSPNRHHPPFKDPATVS
jgi:hypothetical protein